MLMMTVSINAFAAEKTRVYSYRTDAYAGSYIDIPLYIENNNGMMGFKITVSYSTDAFSLDYVVPSDKLSEAKGKFSTNDIDGKLHIAWSHTKNVAFDGELIIIRLNVKNTAPNGGYTIGINHSQEDTFNEKWEKLEWKCSDNIINVREEDTFDEPIPPKEENDLTEEEMDEVISDSLVEVGAESVEDLTDEQLNEFVNNAENHIKYEGGKVEIKDDMTAEEKLDEVLSVYPDTWDKELPTVDLTEDVDLTDNNKENPENNPPTTVIVVVGTILAITTIIVVAILYIKKKQKIIKGEDTNEK